MSPRIDLFLAKVAAHSEEECWTWLGATNDRGYPRWGYGPSGAQVNVYAHRFSYETLIGPIPDGLTVDHLCRNIVCVNPAHMELVTKSENTRRRWDLWRAQQAS